MNVDSVITGHHHAVLQVRFTSGHNLDFHYQLSEGVALVRYIMLELDDDLLYMMQPCNKKDIAAQTMPEVFVDRCGFDLFYRLWEAAISHIHITYFTPNAQHIAMRVIGKTVNDVISLRDGKI